MVQSKNFLSLVLLPSLAVASPSFHAHRHAHHRREARTVTVETYVATTTVTAGQVPSAVPIQAEANDVEAKANDVPYVAQPPVAETPTTTPLPAEPTYAPGTVEANEPGAEPAPQAPQSSSAASSAAQYTPPSYGAPSASEVASSIVQPSYGAPSASDIASPSAPPSYNAPSTDVPGGKFTIQNNCDYKVELYVDRTNSASAACQIKSEDWTTIDAGASWTGDISTCGVAHPSYKIRNPAGNLTKELQFEGGWTPASGIMTDTLWYNISFKDCVDDGADHQIGEGKGLMTGCPGGPWYIKGNTTRADPGDAKMLQCHDPVSCCKNTLGGYCDSTARLAKSLGKLEPVSACLGSVDQVSMYAAIC